MTTEENKRLLALASIIADVKTENLELEQRVHQLMDDYNEAVRQKNGLEKRKYEEQPKQTLGEMYQMRDLCDRLESENKQLKSYATAIDSFMKGKKIYEPKDTTCAYLPLGQPTVGSPFCLKCESFLHLLDDCGVVCRCTLEGAITKQ